MMDNLKYICKSYIYLFMYLFLISWLLQRSVLDLIVESPPTCILPALHLEGERYDL